MGGSPEIMITLDLISIIDTFQNLRFLGELRQRWREIKKLQLVPLMFTILKP